MAQVGSFALLLALASSAYCVVAGIIAIVSKRAFAAPLGETARRAGAPKFERKPHAEDSIACHA
jgi:hypothetical protein